MRVLTQAISAMVIGSLLVVGMVALPRQMLPIAAAQGTGSVTGQVVWCALLPVSYGVQGASGLEVAPHAVPDETQLDSTEMQPEVAPGSGIRPIPVPRPRLPRPIPAGAVLVAVQGTNLSARTDENGQFRIDGLSVGQFLTIAAGPVRGAATAISVRPNVLIREAGQTFNAGRMSLGQNCPQYGGVVPAVPGAAVPEAFEATPDEGDIP